MSTWVFTLLVGLVSLGAGLLGSLTGLGGGVVLVPLLTLVFGVDIRYAMGASLISVIATSSGAAAAYVREGYSNIRIGMFLEVATTLGALAGTYVTTSRFVPTSAIAVIFGIVLLLSACLSSRHRMQSAVDERPESLAAYLRLNGSYPTTNGPTAYHVQRVPQGFALMFVAGILSGLLGIGSGAFKVLALDQVMQLPFKVSTTTSNFMIGVTAAASAGVFLGSGWLDPGLSMPVMLGVLAGSLVGSRLLTVMQTRWLRRIFALVIIALAFQMIYQGIYGFK